MLSEKAGNAFSEYGDCTEEIKQNSKETKSEQDKKYSGLVRNSIAFAMIIYFFYLARGWCLVQNQMIFMKN